MFRVLKFLLPVSFSNKLYYYQATLRGFLLIRKSNLFDKDYYLKQNPDVYAAGINPLRHYIFNGGYEGRNPGPDFHSSFYTSHYTDVKKSCLNPLIHYLLYGKKQKRKIIASKENIDVAFRKDWSKQFSKELVVIIPVYIDTLTSLDVFQNCIQSIIDSYPQPDSRLRFLFIDDCSPLNVVSQVYERSFFKRSDTRVHFNEKNIGFLQSANKGFKLRDRFTDVVLQNSDTRIYSNTYEILQDVAYRYNNVASVTPVSNKASIASISNWPVGSNSINGFNYQKVGEKINSFRLISPPIPVPTGHGYCMYLTGKALDKVGYFNEKSFGRGYGEENDWSQRAFKSGFINLISTEAFVYHKDTTSFTSEEKQIQLDQNLKILETIHPNYHHDVRQYIKDDYLYIHRMILKLRLTEIYKEANKLTTLAFLLHKDPFTNKGGTEVHVKDLVSALLKYSEKFEILIFFPKSNGDENSICVLYRCQNGDHDLEIWLTDNQFFSLQNYLSKRIDYIHIHHIYDWPKQNLEWIKSIRAKKKIITLHDFSMFCVNPNLIYQNNIFCNHRGKSVECSKCFRHTNENDRESNLEFLQNMDSVFVPSENTRGVIAGLAGTKSIIGNIEVLPHFLPFKNCNDQPTRKNSIDNNLIVFLGGAADVKGIEQFLEAKPTLEKMDFRCEIWGYGSFFTNGINTNPYQGFEGLSERNPRPAVVVLPSVWPETFSYTLFEALYILSAPVVVGPYGNPSEFVHKNKVGCVLNAFDASALVEAIEDVFRHYRMYKQNVLKVVEEESGNYCAQKYIEKYENLLELYE